jgi:hypothetical protein
MNADLVKRLVAITPKMAEAGKRKLIELGYLDVEFTDAQKVYEAMAALESPVAQPVPVADAVLESAQKLAREYRPSMPTEVLHLWASDAVKALRVLSDRPTPQPASAGYGLKSPTPVGVSEAEKALVTARKQLVTLGGEPHPHDMNADQIQGAVLFVIDNAIAALRSQPPGTKEPAPGVTEEMVEALGLVERLAGVTEEDAYQRPWTFGELCRDAASRLSEQEEEIARLRRELDAARAERDRANDLLSTDEMAERAILSAIAIDGLKSENDALKAEVEKLKAALEPFATFGEWMELETEGFSDTDELQLMCGEHLFENFKVGDFRRARALEAQGGENG